MSWRPIRVEDAEAVAAHVAVAMGFMLGDVTLSFVGGVCSGITMPREPNDDLDEWQWIETHGVRRTPDGTFWMLDVCTLPSGAGFVPAEPLSCVDAPTQRCASCPRSIAEIKALLVLALRYDRHTEVASLRAELVEARAAAPTKIEE